MDWNYKKRFVSFSLKCHLPRGRCGLKWVAIIQNSSLSWSPSARKVWIEMYSRYENDIAYKSPSARKVWIEMMKNLFQSKVKKVTFREEGVDWNWTDPSNPMQINVTFREEGVDWNSCKISHHGFTMPSPSARKVWIEILYIIYIIVCQLRHLPRGRCGLKSRCTNYNTAAWVVTFREEGVDWNARIHENFLVWFGHLPRGRCGLK